ncbi:hypothetical protein SERLADRAFT_412899 [Serpula lacrymans var. lacrymans S7.9]|uniref:F-box domain-containing protein n=1 Tax=Serpula lacrymans var. lacrymans (strain S7.9) TaxID=578457 RepID=F8NGI0_SERL9|nr:uncharacterized protein SERLADRAFT_412899 [Serpula lacrymans var. lacrymans S7.9]EGO29367.1 hypothetical protein SERLADRAFT_412899 [Serpula lacrymans var. lacrymans S7.9]
MSKQPSKRPRTLSSSSPSRSRKRTIPQFGAPTTDDSPNANPSTHPATNPFSTRTPLYNAHGGNAIPALSTLAARVFVASFRVLGARGEVTEGNDGRTGGYEKVRVSGRGREGRRKCDWAYTARWLRALPDLLASRLFAMLTAAVPAYLSHALIVTIGIQYNQSGSSTKADTIQSIIYFLRGPSVTLTNDLTGVERATLFAIPRITRSSATDTSTLRELHLIGLDAFSDSTFASIITSLPELRVLVLRGCTKVSFKTVQAAASSCPSLQVVNLNYTVIPPSSLITLFINCRALEVLKVAGVPNWTDATFSKLLAGLCQSGRPSDSPESDAVEPQSILARNTLPLRTLKLRQTGLSDTSIHAIVALCPHLRRLDISFTSARHLPWSINTNTVTHANRDEVSKNNDSTNASTILPLEKLTLTATQIPPSSLLSLLPRLPHLHVLALGAMGSAPSTSRSGVSAGMGLTDEVLGKLTDGLVLAKRKREDKSGAKGGLESVNLAGNSKLGFTSRAGRGALEELVRRIGRGCKKLNLAGVSSLRSADLRGLLEYNDGEDGRRTPTLEHLVLTNTGIDDEAAPYIAACSSLAILELGGTKITSAGLFPIIDACPRLEKLDLTSCRGVSVVDRRRFFEVWEREWKDN